jgi:predicted GIY-YIG superfamily endonuclease
MKNNQENVQQNWYCYILKNNYDPDKNRTYNGSTNNPKRRLRQHNGEIVGGAFYTKKFGNSSWKIYAIVTGFPDHKNALQCEWKIKHPNNRRRKGVYCTPKGRIKGLSNVLKLKQWTKQSIHDNKDMQLKVWIINEFKDDLNELPDNIEIHLVDEIDLDELL